MRSTSSEALNTSHEFMKLMNSIDIVAFRSVLEQITTQLCLSGPWSNFVGNKNDHLWLQQSNKVVIWSQIFNLTLD